MSRASAASSTAPSALGSQRAGHAGSRDVCARVGDVFDLSPDAMRHDLLTRRAFERELDRARAHHLAGLPPSSRRLLPGSARTQWPADWPSPTRASAAGCAPDCGRRLLQLGVRVGARRSPTRARSTTPGVAAASPRERVSAAQSAACARRRYEPRHACAAAGGGGFARAADEQEFAYQSQWQVAGGPSPTSARCGNLRPAEKVSARCGLAGILASTIAGSSLLDS